MTGMKTTGARTARLRRGDLHVDCEFGPDGRLRRKVERLCGGRVEYDYAFDKAGRLLGVRRNGRVVEEYRYDGRGRRIRQQREGRGLMDPAEGRLCYDAAGRLVRAGTVRYAYDDKGALAARSDGRGVTYFCYNGDTMPDAVILPNRVEIRQSIFILKMLWLRECGARKRTARRAFSKRASLLRISKKEAFRFLLFSQKAAKLMEKVKGKLLL